MSYLLFSFDGRIGRVQFLICRVFLGLVSVFCLFLLQSYLVGGDAGSSGWILIVVPFDLAVHWPMSAVSVKRGHDRNRPAWWTLTAEAVSSAVAIATWFPAYSPFWTLIRLALLLYWTIDYLCLPASPEARRYGARETGSPEVTEASLLAQRPLLLNQTGGSNAFANRQGRQTAFRPASYPFAEQLWPGMDAGYSMVRGDNGSMHIEGDKLVINRRATDFSRRASAFFMATGIGLQGDKYINISNITAVAVRPPSDFSVGYIRLSTNGRDPIGGLIEAMQDENAVTFSSSAALASFELFRDRLLLLMDAPKASFPAPSIADEIERLSALRNTGVLSDEEFATLKSRIISG